MSARLLLVPPAHRGSLADRFAVGDAGWAGVDRHAIAALQPAQHNGEMIIVDPAQDRLVAGIVLDPFQRRVFLTQAVQRSGQFHVVRAVAGGDRQRRVARRVGNQRRFANLGVLAPQHLSWPRAVELGHRHHITGLG